jgi:hypothetical protein
MRFEIVETFFQWFNVAGFLIQRKIFRPAINLPCAGEHDAYGSVV